MRDAQEVLAGGDSGEFERAVVRGAGGLRVVGGLGFEEHFGIRDGTMARVMDDAAHWAEDGGGRGAGAEQGKRYEFGHKNSVGFIQVWMRTLDEGRRTALLDVAGEEEANERVRRPRWGEGGNGNTNRFAHGSEGRGPREGRAGACSGKLRAGSGGETLAGSSGAKRAVMFSVDAAAGGE